MTISRREFLYFAANLIGGWALTWRKRSFFEVESNSLFTVSGSVRREDLREIEGLADDQKSVGSQVNEQSTDWDSMSQYDDINPGMKKFLDQVGYFNPASPTSYVFDENKYSDSKRKLMPHEWDSTNRHLPIRIDPKVVNRPGERSPEALMRVVEYTGFENPRYVAAPGERVTMCNIAAWDWSRALQLHLPHWIGDTEMSANMLYRWITHPEAGGIYGEGWQPIILTTARVLASLGIPVFALAENTVPKRHGHVAMVYPQETAQEISLSDVSIFFATVNNGRTRGGNGIKSLGNTFRRLTPAYFVHRRDFIVRGIS
ncbi:MAG: hypothetical protein JSV42_04610 [Chloroflexota bacterium]|nr:MAG: hypothetical protein JSV42_04610 [Chloroflexota bacterium]